MVWRVGNGEKISIWGDRWIPTPPSNKVQSPISILPADARVSDLIDQDTRWWNYTSINSIFNQTEAATISNLVLSPLRNEDRLVWSGSTTGLFTVKSAYHMEKCRREQAKGECSNAAERGALWKKVWSMNSLAVLKSFV